MTKRNTKTRVSTTVPTIVLKTIHNDILRDNPNSSLTTKKMRVRLRATMNEIHVRNASWIFTQPQYETVRAMFDAKYAARNARASKRAAKTNAKTETTPAPVTTD